MTDTNQATRTELLIVKTGGEYVRFLDEGYERCAMNKASVFPLADLALVQQKCALAFVDGTEFILRKLVITEEVFEE